MSCYFNMSLFLPMGRPGGWGGSVSRINLRRAERICSLLVPRIRRINIKNRMKGFIKGGAVAAFPPQVQAPEVFTGMVAG